MSCSIELPGQKQGPAASKKFGSLIVADRGQPQLDIGIWNNKKQVAENSCLPGILEP